MTSVLRFAGLRSLSSEALVQEINAVASRGATMDAMQMFRVCGHVLSRDHIEEALYASARDMRPRSFRVMAVWASALLLRPDSVRDGAVVARLRALTKGDAAKAELLARVAKLMGVAPERSGGLRAFFAAAWETMRALPRGIRLSRPKVAVPDLAP